MARTRIHQYPDDWADIARSIKEREGWKCAYCGVAHHRYILRNRKDQSVWRYAGDDDYTGNKYEKLVKVILSVHHIGIDKPDGTPGSPHDKMDNRPENLVALCSRCHLIADLPNHMANAKETRIEHKRQSQLEAGQGELF